LGKGRNEKGMLIGNKVLARINGELKECEVIEIGKEDLTLKYEDIIITRKFWEIAKIPKKNE
jgi:hypothetical protein